jgi:hypothetical protein
MPLKQYIENTGRNLFTKRIEYEQPTLKGSTAEKQEQKDQLKVDLNTAQFQGDLSSIGYMSAVLALASEKFNRLLSEGETAANAYNQVYGDTVPWKDADNVVHQITIENLRDILRSTMDEIAVIIGAK